jgi:hypothetical protein
MQISLEYPVFLFQKNDDMIYVFFNDIELKSTNTQIFKVFNYKNVIHIDSLGNRYKIKKAFKVKYLGLLGFNPLLKGRQILIDFEYELEVEQIQLLDFKKDLIQRVDKKKQIWQSGWDINELKEAITNSSSFKEIAYLLK